MIHRLEVAWRDREPPLGPVCAVATGAAARAMAERLLDRPDAALARLRAAGGPSLLAILGEADDLPWVDGITYLGRDPAAPSLLLPTHRAPTVHAALLERALLGLVGRGAPVGVLLDPPRLVPLGVARVLDREALPAWLGARR
jgi:hypothetical protein